MLKEILAYYKETEKKHRWDALVDDAPFELYIPKWRIPHPTPSQVLIRIFDSNESFSSTSYARKDFQNNPGLAKEPIFTKINFLREHTKTFRYDPAGDKKEWQIGSPYIPKQLLDYQAAKTLFLVVEWKYE